MRPFTTNRLKLPGLEEHPDGRVSFNITDEEKAHVDRFFQMILDSSQDTEEGKWYMRSDLQQAAVAWQLMDYALSQVRLTEVADKDKVDKHTCLHKALAAALKAHSLHPLPIYLFDAGCIFERFGAPDSARDFFGLFLDSQRNYKASEADAFIPRLPFFYKSGIEAVCDPSASEFIPAQHDVGAAVRYAEERTETSSPAQFREFARKSAMENFRNASLFRKIRLLPAFLVLKSVEFVEGKIEKNKNISHG